MRFPSGLLSSAVATALEQDVTLGHYIRDLIRRDLSRRAKLTPRTQADEALVAPLRARLAGDLAFSRTWEELQARLTDKGYVLREAGGGLALHGVPGGERVCKASELGFSYGRLMRRFGIPLPGHAHTWLIPEVCGRAEPVEEDAPGGLAGWTGREMHRADRNPSPRDVSGSAGFGEDEDDFEVIEFEPFVPQDLAPRSLPGAP